jgi:hypothetical protein
MSRDALARIRFLLALYQPLGRFVCQIVPGFYAALRSSLLVTGKTNEIYRRQSTAPNS